MALKGKIDDFGIVEIFQLISQQQRSGVLTIQSSEKKADILFLNGMISKARPFYLSPKRDPFGDAAIKARLVTEEGLQRVMAAHNESLKSLEEVFLDMNLLNVGQIKKINNYLLIETLYDVLQWKSGDYEFSLKEIEHNSQWSAIFSTEHILLDLLRMIDEEPELFQKIPHLGIIFQKNPLDEKTLPGINGLSINEKNIYRLVDGIKTIHDIVYQSLLGRYDTLKALHRLLEGHFIKRITAKKAPSLKPAIKRNYWQYVFYGISPLILVLFLLGLRLLLSPSLREDIVSYKKVFAKTQVQKIKNTLDVYFLKNGNYPVSLEGLVSAGLIKKEDLTYPGGVKYSYHLQADGNYHLEDASL